MLKGQLIRLSRNVLIYGLGGLVNRFVGFLLLPIFTAYLTPQDYGISSILGWLTFLLMPLFSLGLGAAMAPCYFEGNDRERKEGTVWTAFTLLVFSSSVLAVLGLGFSRPISQLAFQTPVYQDLVAMSLITTSLSIVTTPFTLYLQFEERAKLFVLLALVSTLTSVGLSLVMVVGLNKGVRGLIEANLMAQPVNLLLFLWPALFRVPFRFNLSVCRELLRLGMPLIPSFAFVFVLQHGNRYILEWFAGLGALGIYTIGFNFGLVMALIVSAFQNAWVPFFMSFVDDQEKGRRLFGRVLTYYVFGVGGLSLLFFIFAKPVILLMTQPPFHEAYKVVGLSASAQFLLGVFYILLPGMYFAKEVKYVSLIQGVAAMVSVGLSLVLILLFGTLGAALATPLGFVGLLGLTHLWNQRRGDRYLQVPIEWGRIVRFSLLYIGCAFAMLMDRPLSLFGEIVLSLGSLLAIVGFLVVLLHEAERRSLLETARKLVHDGLVVLRRRGGWDDASAGL